MNLDGKPTEEVITIKGMHCKNCVRLIESEISQLRGVRNIKVNLAENSALVKFDPEVISSDKIKSKITSLGYSTSDSNAKRGSFIEGVVYGVIPHTGCIAFTASSIVGATAAMNFFRPLLMNPYFFHILIGISLIFATVSSAAYLKRNSSLSFSGIKRKWKYLSIMYSSTVSANLLFFMVVFPLLANVSASSTPLVTFGAGSDNRTLSFVQLQVDIPCPGHAPLISEELRSIQGVVDVRFSYPNYFEVSYDARTSLEEILSLDVFAVYKATVTDENLGDTGFQVTGGCCGGSCRGARGG